jgi:hypothetical protein
MKIKLNKGLLLAIPAMIVFAGLKLKRLPQVKNRE